MSPCDRGYVSNCGDNDDQASVILTGKSLAMTGAVREDTNRGSISDFQIIEAFTE